MLVYNLHIILEIFLLDHRFGHLACFASDVEFFLHILDLDKKTQLLEKLMECCESIPTNPRKTLGQHISVFKIQNIVGSMVTHPTNGTSSS